MPAETGGLRAALLGGAFDLRPPRRGDDRRNGEHRQQQERGMNRREQDERHAEPEDPPGRGEHGHVHVVEEEDLVAQEREAIEIVGPLVVRDRRD
jgi:hypothetical protein